MGTADEASKYPPLAAAAVNPSAGRLPSWATGNSCDAAAVAAGPLAKANSCGAVGAAWVTWANSWDGGPPFGPLYPLECCGGPVARGKPFDGADGPLASAADS